MEPVLPVALFTTRDHTPRTRYESWRNLISAVFEPTMPDGHSLEDVRADVRCTHLGTILVTDAVAEAQQFIRSRRLIAAESLDHYMIQVYRSGVCNGSYADVHNTVRPGDVKVVDLARPFHTFNTDFDNTTLTVPRAALAPLLEHPDALHGRVLPRESPFAQVVVAHILALSATAPAFTPVVGVAMAAATVRLMAACLGANTRRYDETKPYRAAAAGQAVRHHIDEYIGSPLLGPDMLVRRFRMSRSQLYRMFDVDGGVVAYIQARRLQRCFLALTDVTQAARGVGEIARSFGFTSEAHFSRAFRRAFSLSPTEARSGAGPTAAAARGTFINDWFRGLTRIPAT